MHSTNIFPVAGWRLSTLSVSSNPDSAVFRLGFTLRLIHNGSEADMEFINKWTVCCLILHNFLNRESDAWDDYNQPDDIVQPETVVFGNVIIRGVDKTGKWMLKTMQMLLTFSVLSESNRIQERN